MASNHGAYSNIISFSSSQWLSPTVFVEAVGAAVIGTDAVSIRSLFWSSPEIMDRDTFFAALSLPRLMALSSDRSAMISFRCSLSSLSLSLMIASLRSN